MQLLTGLAPRERAVLELIYFGGLSQADVARALGLSRRAVRICAARGMRHLGDGFCEKRQ